MSTSHYTGARIVIPVGLAIFSGALMTAQARANSQLAGEISNPAVAATISFGSGWLILCVVMLLMPSARAGLSILLMSIRHRKLPWIFTFAGMVGSGYVLSQSLVIGFTGVALFTLAFVCGLIIGGLLIDLWGIGPAGRKHLTVRRILGAVLAILSIVLVVSGQPIDTNAAALLIMPAVFGVLVSWQQAANGRSAAAAKSPWPSTWINFSVGTGVLLIASAFLATSQGIPAAYPSEPWMYFGGAFGVVFIAVTSVVVRYIGVLILGLATITGQLVTAVIFDAIAPSGHPLTAMTLWGTALIMVATVVATIPQRQKKAL